MTSSRKVNVVEGILSANDRVAARVRESLDGAKVFAVNLMASPGAGKTSLVEQTVRGLRGRMRLAVVDGDLATSLDADRAAAAGAQALQVNTGGQCHLDAPMIEAALAKLDLASTDILLVENVGNLVCPASFALGTHRSVLVASVPEGDDKPYKYPPAYRGIDVLILNKVDLLPYVDFRIDYFRKGVEILNPHLRTFVMSCRTGEGVEAWLEWLVTEAAAFRAQHEAR
jgi:hydrogenase nickel incorporation protein HypB